VGLISESSPRVASALSTRRNRAMRRCQTGSLGRGETQVLGESDMLT